jgi:exonuclease III
VSYRCSECSSPTEDKTDSVKDSFYEELEHMFDKFPKYHMKMLLGDFNANVRRIDILKSTIGNESYSKFATSKYLSRVQCSHIVTFINLLGHHLMERLKTIDHILIGKRWHSCI